MEESAQCLENSSSLCVLSELCCSGNEDAIKHFEADEFFKGDSSHNQKKKNKHRGALRRIAAFNALELSTLNEHKVEMKKCTTGIIGNASKSSSFAINSMLENSCPPNEGCGDSAESKEHCTSSSPLEGIPILPRVASPPLKSSLRGGYEELGFGRRPKLHVKWDPSVWEPPYSTVSHTLNKNRPKIRHGHKGRLRRNGLHKQDKKKPHKVNGHSGTSADRRHGRSCEDGGEEVKCPVQADVSGGNHELLISSNSSLMDGSPVVVDSDNNGPTSLLESGLVGGVQYPFESTCGGLLFEPQIVSCSFLYGKAM